MNKITSLLVALMVLAGQIFNYMPVFADGADEEGEYWYISEIIDFRKTSKAEIAELCKNSGNYENCFLLEEIKRVNLYGYKYDAVWQTDQRFFTITAINPLRSTIRMHYTGKNNENNSYDAHITELYLYWIEDGKITPQLNYRLADTYTEQIKNGEPEAGIHVLYSGQTSSQDMPLFPTNEEIRLTLPMSSDLVLDSNGQIFYTVVNNYGEKRSGFYNYGNCAFGEGTECKGAFYYKNNAYTYMLVPSEETAEDKILPLWEPKPEPEPEPEPILRIWTASELLELSNHIAEEELAECGENIDCRWMLYDERFTSDPELYQALETVTENNFLITAINPTNGTLRSVYRNITPMMVRFGDIGWAPKLTSMTLYWDEISRDDPYTSPEEIMLLPDGTHLITRQNFEYLVDEDAFYGQEIEYQSLIGDFVDDVEHKIYYGLQNEDGYDSWFVNYDACFTEVYIDGYECRLVVDQYGSMYYAPYEANGSIVHIEDLIDEQSSQGNNIEPEELPEEAADTDANQDVIANSAPVANLSKAPDSGFGTNESINSTIKIPREREKQSSWWVVAVALSGFMVAYLLSKPHQNRKMLKKVTKKS